MGHPDYNFFISYNIKSYVKGDVSKQAFVKSYFNSMDVQRYLRISYFSYIAEHRGNCVQYDPNEA